MSELPEQAISRDPAYPHWARVPTRWHDNDAYGHVNNTVHYLAVDTVVNAWLIAHAGLDLEHGAVIGLCVESSCRYVESLSYPDAFDVGLRIGRLGSSSVVWVLALHRASDGAKVADATFVHVFVDRGTRRPVPLPEAMREPMTSLVRP